MSKSYVCYSDFGAKGDGVTNDFFAIKAAHDYANANGLPVRAESGKTYLIGTMETGGVADTICVKTDTDWCGAHIIIDDTNVGWCEGERRDYNTYVFTLENDYPAVELGDDVLKKINERGGIRAGNELKKLDTGLGYPALLIVRNANKRVFIRFGGNEDSGTPQRELILVDAEGNIDETTPFLFDYAQVTAITAYRADTRPISVGNAVITTRASRVNLVNDYRCISRGIRVLRPNVRIHDIEHIITGEYEKRELVDGVPFIGHSSNGFLSIAVTTNVRVENVVFQARVYYLQGTYDIGVNMTNDIIFKNCTQSNFFAGREDCPLYPGLGRLWGVMGSNFCKNMVYDHCRLTRYDAHSGVYNGKILDSDIASLRLTGGGDMLIENTTFYNYSPGGIVSLREDYGVTWHGTLTLRNCKVLDVCKNGTTSPDNIIIAQSPNHYFGYPTYFPNVIIDNLKIENPKPVINLVQDAKPNAGAAFFYRSVCDPAIGVAGGVCTDGNVNRNVYTAPDFLKVINNEGNGYDLTLYDVPFFKETKLEGIRRVPHEENK